MRHDLSSFKDIKAVLDTILRHGQYPARYTRETPKDATRWRHRVHTYRAALRRQEERDMNLPLGRGTSIYDDLIFTLDGQVVVIDLIKPTGLLEIGGREVEPTPDTEAALPLPTLWEGEGLGLEEAPKKRKRK